MLNAKTSRECVLYTYVPICAKDRNIDALNISIEACKITRDVSWGFYLNNLIQERHHPYFLSYKPHIAIILFV